MSDILKQVAQIDQEIEALQKQLLEAKQKQKTAHEKALLEVCPFASMERRERFIPLSATQAIVAPYLSMQPPHTPSGLPRWVARGQQVRFRRGVMETIREGTIDQPAYEALSEEMRALTREQMVENTKGQALTGAGKPLKLTERQLRMFLGLADTIERGAKFNLNGTKEGQRLPGSIWDSQSATQQIWLGMVKRGVLVLASGNPEDDYRVWRVNPGPRFVEAVDLLLDSEWLKPGTIARERALDAFRPSTPKPSAPGKRLRT